MRYRDYWFISSVTLFILVAIICGWMVWHAIYGTFIGFGGLLAGVLLVNGIGGMFWGGGAGAVLGLLSFFKKGRHRKSLIIMSLNIALAVVPVSILNFHQNQQQKRSLEALEAQSPTERLFGMASTTGMIRRKKEFVEFLERGADINALNHDKNFTIIAKVIIYQNEPELIDFLMEHGVDINLQAIEGWGPLHVAAAAGKVKMMEKLLDHGADRTLLTNKNETALDIAKQRLKLYVNNEYEQQRYKDIIFLLQ